MHGITHRVSGHREFRPIRRASACSSVAAGVALSIATASAPAHASIDTSNILCFAFDHLDDIMSSQGTVNTECHGVNHANTYYLGGFPSNRGLATFVSKPYLAAGQYYCAIADAHGASAKGTVSPGVGFDIGRFGIDSSLNVSTRNPTAQNGPEVGGERVGALYLFGAKMDFDVQKFKWKFPTETRAAGTVQALDPFTGQTVNASVDGRYGFYAVLDDKGVFWNIDGTASFNVGPARVTLKPKLTKDSVFESLNNAALAWSGSQPNTPNGSFVYDTYQQAHATCMANVGDVIQTCGDAITWQQFFEHYRNVPSGGLAHTSDGWLPMDLWDSGAAGSFLYADLLPNWFHFGRTWTPMPVGNDPIVTYPPSLPSRAEPTYDLGNGAAGTTTFALPITISFSIGIVEIQVRPTTTVTFRSGFDVSRQYLPAGMARETPVYKDAMATYVDAQSSIEVDADVGVRIPNFIKDINLSKHFDIYGPKTTPLKPATPTRISQEVSTFDTGKITEYMVNGLANPNPTDAFNACLKPPATPPPAPVNPGNLKTFFNDIAIRAVRVMHPCHVNLCDDKGVEQRCNWQAQANAMVCTQPGTACDPCDDKIDICDADGNVVVSYDVGAERETADSRDCSPRVP